MKLWMLFLIDLHGVVVQTVVADDMKRNELLSYDKRTDGHRWITAFRLEDQ